MESSRKDKTGNRLIVTYRKSIIKKYINSSRVTTSDLLHRTKATSSEGHDITVPNTAT